MPSCRQPEPALARRALLGAGLGLIPWHGWATAGADAEALLRKGGVVVVFRHALAPGTFDPPGFRLGDCSTQRNLSEEGREQARRIGQWFRAHDLRPRAVLSSAAKGEERSRVQALVERLIPAAPTAQDESRARHLDPHALPTPSLALTCAGETGAAAILARIGADPAAFPLVVVREPGWADVDRVQLAHEIRALIAGSGGRVLLAGATTPVAGLDGVHLTAAQLMAQDTRPAADWAGASVHRQEELEQAARLGLDYVMLGHVMPTPSHPGVPPLGWSRFAGLAGGRWPMPVYALGGMQPQDMQAAQAHGAHGIAMMRGAWQ